MNERNFQKIIDEFTVGKDELEQIAAAFRRDIEMGLARSDACSLRMLKSYVGLPTGEESGEFLALDFGGTNVRVLLIRLLGDGCHEVLGKVAKPLVVQGVYDFVGSEARAEDLFDFIAGLVEEVLEGNREREYLLGHTFSFPSEQTNLYNARLIAWTKEFATQGVEGQVVNDLLNDAFRRNGLHHVRPVAVINDTVATLLAAAYKTERTYIGSICATGHNTAYLESYHGAAQSRMILNLESGRFNKLLVNSYDKMLDGASERPGEQRLEKMVSGKYLGVLFGLALADGLGGGEWAFEFTSIDLSVILCDNTAMLLGVRALIEKKTGIVFDTEACEWCKAMAESIVIRSARLVAATYVGIIWHLNDGRVGAQCIAIDGSLYEKMPLYEDEIKRAMYEVLGEDASKVVIVLENSGSGVGAALAAAI